MRLLADLVGGGALDIAAEEILAELLAAQALAAAAYRGETIGDVHHARQLIERTAGYPGVTMRRRPEGGPDVGQRATERLWVLAGKNIDELPWMR